MAKNKAYNKLVAGTMTAAMVAGVVTPAAAATKSFPDVPADHWAADSINYLVDKGAINGKPDGTFAPTEEIDRASAAKIMAVTLGLEIDQNAKPSFEDAKNNWAAPYIAAVEKAGVIQGDGKGNFKPDDKINRASMASMLVKAYKLEAPGAETKFDDLKDHWGEKDANILVALGISNGTDNGWQPDKAVTRAEAAQFIAKTDSQYGKQEVKEAKVENVTAINAKEIKVTFNKEVNKESAENVANYEVFNKSGDSTDKVAGFQAKLQDDKKTVILQLPADKAFANGSTVKVTTKNILDKDYAKVKDFTGEYAIFNDQTAPAVTDMVLSGSTLTVTFSEPVKNVGSLRVDGKTVAAPAAFYTKAGDYKVVYNITDQDMLTKGTHNAVFYAADDFAGNSASMITTKYEATDNNVKPSVSKVEAVTTDTFRVTFASAVNPPTEANFVIKKGNHTFQDSQVAVTPVVGSNGKSFDVKIDATTGTNPLYGQNENSVNLSVEVKDYKGTNDVFGDKYTTNVTLTKDTAKPVVQNAAINTADGKVLTVIFNEELDAAADLNKVSVTKDGVRVPVSGVAVNTADKKKAEITLGDDVTDGTYNVVFGAGAVKDLAGNENAAQNTQVTATVASGKVFEPTVEVSQVNGTQNKLTITYGKEMTASAVDLKNYKIDGVPLNNPLYAGTDIAFTDGNKNVVEIVLPKGQVSSESYTALVEIAKDVKSTAGEYVAKEDKSTFSTQPTGKWADDVAPVLNSAVYVKENANDTSSNVLKLTFSEAVTSAEVNDYLVNIGGSDVEVIPSTSGTTTANKEIAVKLGTDVNLSQAGTVSITADKKHNADGINIADEAGNKATEKQITVNTSVVDAAFFQAAQ